MDVLESPLEAFVLSFYFLTTVRSFWTWGALLLAAGFSFWRIRTVGSQSRPKSDDSSWRIRSVGSETSLKFENNSSDRRTTTVVPTQTRDPLDLTPSPSPSAHSINGGDEEDEGGRKGKFTVYYYDDSVRDDGELTVINSWIEGEGKGISESLWEVEGVVRLPVRRALDLGWYRFQDLTVLNGNVVKLWNGERSRVF
ncbi:uncharacterized protein LOC143876848 [Tasmannia lanceolata]|uniref:uncharacterized protein LOC143876848 n=1 Tax=Tasmannia lanceolata TaxID=3420 RepID=UPI004063D9EA